MLSMVNGLGLCRCRFAAAPGVALAVIDGIGGGDSECSACKPAAGDIAAVSLPDVCSRRPTSGGEESRTAADEDRPNVASSRARSVAGSLNRLRRRRNEPFSNMSRAFGCKAQYAPLPGRSGRRGIFTKQSLNDRLCRNEFCHLQQSCGHGLLVLELER